MTPIARRRWNKFRANRRGWWSLWIFAVLFAVAMCAEFLANDKPILVKYQGALHMPVFRAYPETAFGGDFETETDYRDPAIAAKIRAEGWMVWPPVHYSYRTINYTLTHAFPSPPDSENWLGTDDQGRDVVARLLYGFRLSVLFGLILTAVSAAIGVMVGAVQGYVGGWLDLLMQRFIEIWSSMPELMLIMILSSFVMPNFWWLLLILLLFSWMSLVRVVRAESLKTRNMEYVRAARALGVKEHAILFRHVIPNSLVAAVTYIPFLLNGSLSTLTALDYLGFGLPPGAPSLGELLREGKNNLDAPWLGFSGFFITALMLSLFIFIGEAVRDAFDPRKE